MESVALRTKISTKWCLSSSVVKLQCLKCLAGYWWRWRLSSKTWGQTISPWMKR